MTGETFRRLVRLELEAEETAKLVLMSGAGPGDIHYLSPEAMRVLRAGLLPIGDTIYIKRPPRFEVWNRG